VVKAHHPANQPHVAEFQSRKIICCVRNPVDLIVSFANLVNTMSHSIEFSSNFIENYPNWWDWWVRTCAENHAKYIATLLQHHATEKRNPIYFLRYEDLILNQEEELTELFKFLLDLESLHGTNIERRIKEVVNAGQEQNRLYKLKQSTGKLHFQAKNYTQS
jgi:hypothetical protein